MIKNRDIKRIPEPSLKRLCKIYSLFDDLEKIGINSISSREIGKRIGAAPHNIRKDMSYLVRKGKAGSGYDIQVLKKNIEQAFGFHEEKKACVIGIGKLGTAIMNYEKLITHNFKIVAGFDSNINKLETIKTDIPVYPTHEIQEIVNREKIDLAVITVPAHAAMEIANQLIICGIKGIINFSPIVISSKKKNVHISNIDIINDFRFISASFTMNRKISNLEN